MVMRGAATREIKKAKVNSLSHNKTGAQAHEKISAEGRFAKR